MALNLLNSSINDTGHKILESIDWSYIVDHITTRAHLDLTIQSLLAPPTYRTEKEIKTQLWQLDYFVNFVLGNNYQSFYTLIRDVSPSEELPNSILHLKKSGVLQINEIFQISNLLSSYFEIQRQLKDYSDHIKVFEQSDRSILINKLIKSIRQIVDPDGTINYNNHPKLRPIYKELCQIDDKLRGMMQKLASSDLYRSRLQFDGHDVINDSFVLAIRSDNYQSDLGLIRGRSDKGHTLYVEPFSVRTISQRRMELIAEIQSIIATICREYCDLLFPYTDKLDFSYGNLVEIDTYLAKADFCIQFGLHRPSINNDSEIKLTSFFHPLIENPVKNDVWIKAGKQGLILSGPNTGGKTAALKAIAICHLFLHYGLYIPAQDSSIPIFDGIYFIAYDHQDINQGLSSFSAEVGNYIDLLKELKGNNLIIIDEIFNSTSSEEASALAIGLLEEIEKKSESLIFLSTHHQTLKSFMHENENYVSSHVGFDLESNSPSYKINVGTPGSSMALNIFERIAQEKSLKSSIVDRAETVLNKKYVNYEKLLQKVSQKEGLLSKTLLENTQLQKELRNQKASMDGILKLKLEQEIQHFNKTINDKMDKAEKILQELKQGELKSIKKAQTKLADLKIRNESDFNKIDPMEKLYSKIPQNIDTSKRYYSTQLKKIVTIKSINERKKLVNVSSGKLSIQTPISSLREIPSQKPMQTIVRVNVDYTDSEVTTKIDCRGMRLDDFISTIEKSLPAIQSGKIPFLEVVHGHGEGVLKNWLRSYLRKFTDLSWDPDKSDGVTHIKASED